MAPRERILLLGLHNCEPYISYFIATFVRWAKTLIEVMIKNSMLKRYWFVIHPEDKFGPRNIGVTAYSIQEAKNLVVDAMEKAGWNHITQNSVDNAEVIEEIDVRMLDQGHVIPNMGVVIFEGVWFP